MGEVGERLKLARSSEWSSSSGTGNIGSTRTTLCWHHFEQSTERCAHPMIYVGRVGLSVTSKYTFGIPFEMASTKQMNFVTVHSLTLVPGQIENCKGVPPLNPLC